MMQGKTDIAAESDRRASQGGYEYSRPNEPINAFKGFLDACGEAKKMPLQQKLWDAGG